MYKVEYADNDAHTINTRRILVQCHFNVTLAIIITRTSQEVRKCKQIQIMLINNVKISPRLNTTTDIGNNEMNITTPPRRYSLYDQYGQQCLPFLLKIALIAVIEKMYINSTSHHTWTMLFTNECVCPRKTIKIHKICVI